MNDRKRARIIGVLFLIEFILGVVIYQILQGPILFADDFLSTSALNSSKIISSTLLGLISGSVSVLSAVLLLPILKRTHVSLAYLYIAFCIVSFCAVALDNSSVLSLLELSKEYVKFGSSDKDYFQNLGSVFYRKHYWTHYMSLIISCIPLFIFYTTLFYSKLIPRAISVFGLIAVALMFLELIFSIFDNSISMNLMMPLGLVQLLLPFWLIFKGFTIYDQPST